MAKTIKETHISEWANHQECRNKLPILVRRLIRETVPLPLLHQLRFPGNEAVDLEDFDGWAETKKGTPWVPEGTSLWEMGCSKKPSVKAKGDYEKRTVGTPENERATSAFVFVTPKRWKGKKDWLKERKSEAAWAEIRAYDAIDLETWLEEAPATSRWLGSLLGMKSRGLLSPDEWWDNWATVSEPPIPMRIVAARRQNEAKTLVRRLRDGNSSVPVQADDQSEAVAFTIAAMSEEKAHDLLDRTLVVTSGDAEIPPAGEAGSIIITDLPEGEREPYFGDRRQFSIVRTSPKGRSDAREYLLLSRVPSNVFLTELERMGRSRNEARNLALQSGHSIPVLRRLLSLYPEIRDPVWARDLDSAIWERAPDSAKRLLPFALAGSWVEQDSRDDDVVLQLLGNLGDGEIERIRDDLLALDDSPIAQYGDVNVVVSQLDALLTVGPHIESGDLGRFFDLVPHLLGEHDPALDLPQDQWWMADVLGKGRKYSEALLSGLSNALCILATKGAEIAGGKYQQELKRRASQTVSTLMKNADEKTWLTIRNRLREFAEAAPNTFLDCLEKELQKPNPAIKAIMGVTDGSFSGECLRTHLLWALELLAWDPAYFSRVARLVFGLQRFEIKDNWVNTPESTAKSLFRAWFLATAVRVDERMRVLRDLSKEFRVPTMKVCISLLPGGGPDHASGTARPQWLPLEHEIADPTNEDVNVAAIEAGHLLVGMAPFDKEELETILKIADRLHPDDMPEFADEVERWGAIAPDEEKAELRNELRRQDTWRARRRDEEEEEFASAIKRMEDALEPKTSVTRHRWLFEASHIDWRELVEEESEGRLSWGERTARVQEKRAEAIAEVQAESGEEAILPFALSVKHPNLVAEVLVSGTDSKIAAEWVGRALNLAPGDEVSSFLRQILWSAGRGDLLGKVIQCLDAQGVLKDRAACLRVAEHLPGIASGWQAAEMLGVDASEAYWNSVSIKILNDTPTEDIKFAVTKLLEARRPRSAFHAVDVCIERVAPELLERILQAVARGEEKEGMPLNDYFLAEAFKRLDGAPNIADERIAKLEFPFMEGLCRMGRHDHGDRSRTLALHREMARKPPLFIELLSYAFNRKDGNSEPKYENMPENQRSHLATLGFRALSSWDIVPGSTEDGDIDPKMFASWTKEALQLATDADRRKIAEITLGELLGHYAFHRPLGKNWLPEVILDFLDHLEDDGVREGFSVGIYNARGVVTRGLFDGGEQELGLAAGYRDLASQYAISHPRVSALFTSIAEGYKREAKDADDRGALGERWHP